MATAIIGVKFGGWGISLENSKIKIKPTGKISFCNIFFKFFIFVNLYACLMHNNTES